MGVCEVDSTFRNLLHRFMDGLWQKPREVSLRLAAVATSVGLDYEERKCSDLVLQAVVRLPACEGQHGIFVKFVRPSSPEGANLHALLPHRRELAFPAIYHADDHWIITHFIEKPIPYSSDPPAFVEAALRYLPAMHKLDGGTPITRVDKMDMWLDDKWACRLTGWLKNQRIGAKSSFEAEIKSVDEIGSERERLRDLIGELDLVLSHGDFEPQNILRMGATCHVVDWADCAMRPIYADVAWLFQCLEAVYDLPQAEASAFWASYREKQQLQERMYRLYRVLSGLKLASNIVGHDNHVASFVKHMRLVAENWCYYKECSVNSSGIVSERGLP